MPDVTPDLIMKIAMGFMAAKHLFAANEIGLFEGLAAGPANIAELATKTTIPPRTLAIVANAMVSLGLVERQGDRYRNSDVAAAFLAGRPGADLRPMLRFWNQISYPTWQKLDEALRTGEGQAQFGRFNKEEQQIFSAGVESFSAPVAAALAASYDFSQHRRVLDVGGGTGRFSSRCYAATARSRARYSSCRAPARSPASTSLVSRRGCGSRLWRETYSKTRCPGSTTP
jgi:hypothetical protein